MGHPGPIYTSQRQDNPKSRSGTTSFVVVILLVPTSLTCVVVFVVVYFIQ